MKQLPLQLICTLVIILSFPSLTAAQTVPLSSTTAAAGQNSNFPAATLSLPRLQRCAGIKGPACSAYYLQTLEDLQLARPIPQQKPCPINQHTGTPCGLGVCHADTGLCDCPAGVGGPDCSSEDLRPCTNRYRTNRSSTVPEGHISPNKRDSNWREPGWTPSRCAGVCDDTTATCFCDGAHFGRVPALPGSAPGTPPIRPGRLLHGNCQRLTTDDAGWPLHWGAARARRQGGVTYDDIYGLQGWCTVDTPRVRCSCDLDGYDGQLCDVVTETVCPNQCSGQGTCVRGFCKCFPGFFGLDCARLTNAAATTHNPAAPPAAAAATGMLLPQAAAVADASVSTVQPADDSVASAEQERQEKSQQTATPAAAGQAAATSTSSTTAVAAAAGAQQLPQDAESVAAAAAADVPEHVRFLADRPYLSQVVVRPSLDAAASAAGPQSNAAAAGVVPGLDGVSSSSSSSLQAHSAGMIPAIYFTPVNPGGEGSSKPRPLSAAAAAGALSPPPAAAAPAAADAADATGGTTAVNKRRRIRHRHRRSRGTLSWLHQHTAAEHHKQQQQSNLQTEDNKQQQQGSGFMRTLLRHFWTGGGSQRPQLTVAPKQRDVTAAVQDWLSAPYFVDTGGSSSIGGGGAGGLGGGGISSIGEETMGAGGIDDGSNSSSNSTGSNDGDMAVDDSSSSRLGGAGLAEALSAAGVQLGRLGSERNTALLLQMVEAALGQLPPGKARRPRIFVYDMPSRFVSRLLQYRSSKQTCTWRVFSKSNFSLFTTTEAHSSWRYPLESHLHELMLQSPHRTLDPDEADFFYVPVYAACMMEAVAGWADAPWWQVYSKSDVKQGVLMYKDALDWIRTTYPYWNASAGTNHIWLFAGDEGACWAPSEIYNSSLILTQWGRLGPPSLIEGGYGSRHGPVMDSWTSKWSQNWNKWHASNDDPLGLPAGAEGDYTQLLTHHPCYTPGKDLVLPAFRPPQMFRASPFLGGDNKQLRDVLVLLRGDMGKGRPATFSQGVRQQLAQLAAAGDWKRRYNVWIGTAKELPGDRSALLARSRYCLVVPVDGWSGTFEDAVLHGCIPVVVNMGACLAQPFSSLLRLSSGMLQVSTDELPSLPDILLAITPQQEDKMRAALSSWWHRMAWLTHPFVRAQTEQVVRGNLQQRPWVQQALQQQQLKQQQALTSMGRSTDAVEEDPKEKEDSGLLIPVFPSHADSPDSDTGADSGNSSATSADSTWDSDNTTSPDALLPAASDALNDTTPAAAVDDGRSTEQLTDTQKIQQLFEVRVWQPDASVDDAFTTLMQWLHHKMLHPYHRNSISHQAAGRCGYG